MKSALDKSVRVCHTPVMADTTTKESAMTIVCGTPIQLSDQIVYTAWEPYNGHSVVRHYDGQYLGQIGHGPLPVEIEMMTPGSDERILAVAEHYRIERDRAYDAILEFVPEAEFDGRRDGSIVWMHKDDVR